MGVVFAFLVGWAMGSRGGEQGFDDVVTALQEVRESDEFATLIGVLRTHGGQLLHQAADWLQSVESHAPQSNDFIERVRGLVAPRSESADANH